VSKRAQANEEGDKMAKCFQASHEAYASGDGAGAKQLSNEGKEHQRNMESLNREASDWIFAGRSNHFHGMIASLTRRRQKITKFSSNISLSD